MDNNAQNRQNEPKTVEDISNIISQVDQDNIALTNNIHNLEKELELKKSQVLNLSKKDQKKSSPYLVFFIVLALSFWIVLK